MPADQWPGLVTAASPFAIPPTAAVEQTNLVCSKPGEISVRGGMRKVAVVGAAPPLLDCFPIVRQESHALIGMKPDGELVLLASPAYGWAAQVGLEPTLSSPAAILSSSYAYRYVAGESDADSFPPPSSEFDVGGLPYALDGGLSGTLTFTFSADAMQCDVADPLHLLDGGTAATTAQGEAAGLSLCTPPVPMSLLTAGNSTLATEGGEEITTL